MSLFPRLTAKSPFAKPYHVAAAAVLVLLGVLFYWPYFTRMPTGYHSWAQGDRLALAINFYDYGFNFWKPRTSYLGSIGGVTGVEFPIQAYVAALGGLAFGRSSINTVFRVLDVSIALLGMFYLFRIVFERTQHFVAALIPACFLLSSPVFVFYAGNYLPDPASLSLSFVGYYYWLRFFDQRRFRYLAISIVVLTLAGLIKTTSALFLGAVLVITIGWSFFVPDLLTLRQKVWLAVIALGGVGAILGFFYHNQQLNSYYQSYLFLSELKPIKDPDTLHEVSRAVKGYVGGEYATRTMQRTTGASLALFLVFLLPNVRRRLPLVLLVGAAGLIAYGFFWQMGAQLVIHDYYSICSFGPLALLLLLLALLNLGGYGGRVKWVTSIGLCVLGVVMLRDGHKRLQKRMAPEDYAWLHNSSQLLAQHGIPLTTNIFLLGDAAPNTGLVYADRRGLVRTDINVPASLVAYEMARDSIEFLVMPRAIYDSLATQRPAWDGLFAPVMDQPFVIMRRRDMRMPW